MPGLSEAICANDKNGENEIMKNLTLLLCFAFFSVIASGFAQIDVTIPDSKAEKGATVTIPVRVSDLTGKGVISYQFVVTFAEEVLNAVGSTSDETLTSLWGAPYVNTSVNGRMIVGGYGIQELSGAGVLVKMKFVVVGNPGQKTKLKFPFFVFNAGDPAANVSSGVFTVSSSNGVGVKEEGEIPNTFLLEQNYPNPFNSVTVIRYQIPKAEGIKIKIFNILGQEIQTLVREKKKPGYYEICWDGKDKLGREVPGGIYICLATSGDNRQTIKIIKLQ